MMNVKDLNVKKIEDYTSFVIFFIKIIIYLFCLFKNNNCNSHFTKIAFENQ